MQCPYCGGKHPNQAAFCPVTGKALPGSLHLCPTCGQAVKPGHTFCGRCGASQKKAPAAKPAVYLLALVFGLALLSVSGWMFLRGLTSGTPPEIQSTISTAPGSVSSPTAAVQAISRASPAANLSLILPSRTPTRFSTPPATRFPTAEPTLPTTPTSLVLVDPQAVKVNPADGAELVLVPAGAFTMGAAVGSPYFWGAEAPVHEVTLSDYWIYRTEVTNAMYRACAAQKKCPRPAQFGSNTRQKYYEDPQYDSYPVIYVSWLDARAYCAWAGGRLPTEAEWEKAARGTDGRMFPWGDSPARAGLANFGAQDTQAAGSYPAGASPYGALDMAGNVMEWVFDFFQEDYYKVSPGTNPEGPQSGSRHVFRGGAWQHYDEALRSAARASAREVYTGDNIGFRCVMDAE